MAKTRVAFITIILIFILSCSSRAEAPKKLIIVTINTANVHDLLEDPVIRDIANEGLVGLMNTRSSGRNNQYKPYLTIGSGQKGDVSFDCLESFVVDDSIKSKYESITLRQCREGSIVNLSINKIKKINSDTLYEAVPGKLGSILRINALKTAFIGGFSYDNCIKSPAFFIAMDNWGFCDFGEIHGLYEDGILIGERILHAHENYKNSADFMVVELGEIETLYAEKKLYSEESYQTNKKRIVDENGKIIESIIDNTDFSNTVLCIMAPYSSDITKTGMELLSPIILYDGGKSKGILISRTTRRPGIISSLDFAPYVLDYFNLENRGFTGYPLGFKYVDTNTDYILELYDTVNHISVSRTPILKGYAIFIIAISILYILLLLGKSNNLNITIHFLIGLSLIVPFSMLIEGALHIDDTFFKAIFIIVLSLIFEVLTYIIFKRPLNKMIAVTFLNIALLTLDILQGQNMLKYSVLSYDPIIGARYYGIGNEFLGVLIGCSLVFCGCLYKKFKSSSIRTLVMLFLAFVTAMIGLPGLGANAGGLMTAAFCFFIFILLSYNYGIRHAVVVGIIISILCILLIAFMNIIFKNSQSHLGKMIEQVGIEGLGYMYNTIGRKLSMSVRLIKYTIWTRVLIVLIAAAAVLTVKLPGYAQSLFKRGTYLRNSWICALAASMAAIALNDSGIVTAALIMLYVVGSMILLLKPSDKG